MGDFYGIPTGVLSNSFLSLEYLVERAARIVRLNVNGENWLAETPDFGWETAHGYYKIYGGHRLWIAPQVGGRTDVPDDTGITVTTYPNGVDLALPADPVTQLSRRIEIRLEPDAPVVHLKHVLKNEGVWAAECAPWTVTQVRLGGRILVPLASGSLGGNESAPNRMVQFWPCTHLPEPRLQLLDRWLVYPVESYDGNLKMGCFSPDGWIGYALGDMFFKKSFETSFGPAYPDAGCNVEIFNNPRYAELEALGALNVLQPGECTEFNETWEVRPLQEALAMLDEEARKAV